MLTFPGIKADEPIAHRGRAEIKEVLGATLGATLVESTDPLWPDDPQIENMQTSYTRALAELVPIFFPNLLYRVNERRTADLPEFAAAIQPTEFAPAARSDRERWRRRITWWGWRKGGFHRRAR